MKSKSKLTLTVPKEPVSWEVERRLKTMEPKSPVQKRLEKRCRSPFKNSKVAAVGKDLELLFEDAPTSPVVMAKKRREDILEAQAQENARKFARARDIARKTNELRNKEKEELADHIEDKLRAAESRREEILNDRRQRAAPKSPLQKENRRRSVEVEYLESKIQEADLRRSEGYEKRIDQVRQHLQRVQERRDQLRVVRRLQSWWRFSLTTRKVAVTFLKEDTKSHMKTIFTPVISFSEQQDKHESQDVFEAFAKHLSQKEVIIAAQMLLDALKRKTTSRSPKSPATTTSAARSFLAALMIFQHPNTVLGEAAPDKKREWIRKRVEIASRCLCNTAIHLLKVLDQPSSGSDEIEHSYKWSEYRAIARDVQKLRSLHLLYARAFLSWKQIDAICLADELLDVYVQVTLNLEHIITMISSDAIAAQDPGLLQHREGNQGQLNMIELQVRKLLGEREFSNWVSRAQSRIEQHKSSQSPSKNKSNVEKTKQNEVAQSQRHLPKQPKSLFTLPSNEEMVHELMLNKAYELSVEEFERHLSEQEINSVEFLEKLNHGEFGVLLSLVDTVRSRLTSLTPNRRDLIAQLESKLDTSLLAQQLSNNAFEKEDLYQLVQFIGERILALQAPVRQEQTESWLMELHEAASAKNTDWKSLVPGAFDKVLRELAYIDIDMSNFHLRVLASHLQGEKGYEYLRAKFEERVASGEYNRGERTGAPAITESWFLQSIEAATSASLASDTIQVTPPLFDCFMEGFIRYLMDSNIQSVTEMRQLLPETLREYDGERMFRFNRKFLHFSTLSTLYVILTQALRLSERIVLESGESDLKEAQGKLYQLVDRLVGTEGGGQIDFQDMSDELIFIAQTLVEAQPTETGEQRHLSSATKDLLNSLLRQASSGTLSGTVRRQFESIIRKTLKTPDYPCEQLLRKINLDPWSEEIQAMCNAMHAVYNLNWMIHHPLYNTIFTQSK